MKKAYKSLIDKYSDLATMHGVESLLGDKKYRKYHEKKSREYDGLLIAIIENYLKENHVG